MEWPVWHRVSSYQPVHFSRFLCLVLWEGVALFSAGALEPAEVVGCLQRMAVVASNKDGPDSPKEEQTYGLVSQHRETCHNELGPATMPEEMVGSSWWGCPWGNTEESCPRSPATPGWRLTGLACLRCPKLGGGGLGGGTHLACMGDGGGGLEGTTPGGDGGGGKSNLLWTYIGFAE